MDRRGPDECWPWTGVTIKGYGNFWDGTFLPSGHHRMIIASRWGYGYFISPIPDGFDVCHSCDNPPCQNQTHWFLGTHQDNMDDMAAKGRKVVVRGEAHYLTTLTLTQVHEIRQRYAAGGISQKSLGKEYGVVQGTICNIIHRLTWRDSPPPFLEV